MDIVWGVLGYKREKPILLKYPEEVKSIKEFLEKVNINCRNKPGCGGEHKMSDRRVKRLASIANAFSCVRNCIEVNRFSVEIERDFVKKINDHRDLNNLRHLQIQRETTQINLFIPPRYY